MKIDWLLGLTPTELLLHLIMGFVSAPVHPHVLIIVKTHENRVEHILANITNDLTAKNYF